MHKPTLPTWHSQTGTDYKQLLKDLSAALLLVSLCGAFVLALLFVTHPMENLGLALLGLLFFMVMGFVGSLYNDRLRDRPKTTYRKGSCS